MRGKTGSRSNQIWIFFFGFWLLLLTGVLDFWIRTPGIKQWWRVNRMLSARRQEIDAIESRSDLLRQVSHELLENPNAQEREIRKVLGYLGEQEVVFEFSER